MHQAIKHVVVVMLENRSLDNVLGYLYGPDDLPKRNLPPLQPGERPFHGLLFEDAASMKALANDGVAPGPVVRATNSPGWDPGEEFEHVNVQLFGENPPKPDAATGKLPVPSMRGFLSDYSTQCSGDATAKHQIMRMYTPADLPVISRLAKAYAVADLWFASVPTQTNANRAFSLCGTSLGLVNNGYLSNKTPSELLFQEDQFKTDTIWNVLESHGFSDWAIFWETAYPPPPFSLLGRPYTRNLFPRLEQIANIEGHFHKLDEFFGQARSGTLPAYSYIEPRWGGYTKGISAMGDEYHPPSDTTPGEKLLERIYRSLRDGANWESTMLVITFDEHGGTYDHVPPGPARPPSTGGPPGQFGFTFDRYGVRVPTIVVSPYIEAGTVFRSACETPFDHTSVIRTVLEWAIPGVTKDHWGLGARVENAPAFDGVLTLEIARNDDALAQPVPQRSTPLKYGDPFFLRHMSGEFVIGAYSGKRYYYPRLGRSGAVRLDFRLGTGVVRGGAIVQLRTSEYLEPSGTSSPYFANYVAIRNFLGAWKDDHDCYYYSTDDAKDYEQQLWQLSPKDGNPNGPILYGDRITITSHFEDYRGQRLVKDGAYVSTAAGAEEWWSVEPDPQPRSKSPGILQFGEVVQLKHMGGEVVGHNDRTWAKLARTGPVRLKLIGGTGDVTDGMTVSIESTEADLAGKSVLGAFETSHDCYYFTGGYDAAKQGWRITKVNGGDAGIHRGEAVFLTNLSFTGQRLAKDSRFAGYITTVAGAKDWWTLEKV